MSTTATTNPVRGVCAVCLREGCTSNDCEWAEHAPSVDFATALRDMQARPAARYVDSEGNRYAWFSGRLMCGVDGPEPYADLNGPEANAMLRWRCDRCRSCR